MKSVYKWLAVSALCAILAFCFLSVYPFSEAPEIDPPESSEVVGSPQSSPSGGLSGSIFEKEPLFPKMPLVSPFSEQGYLQSVSGSGEDKVISVWQSGEFVLAVGESTSEDGDFCSPCGRVFVAVLSELGRLVSVCPIPDSLFVADSALSAEGLVLLCGEQSGFRLHLFDRGRIISSLPFSTSPTHVITGDSSIFLLDGEAGTVCMYDYTLTKGVSISLGESFIPVDLSLIGESLCILGQKEHGVISFSVRSDLSGYTRSSPLEDYQLLSALPTGFSEGFGYVCLAKREDELFLLAVTGSKMLWTRSIGKGTDGAVVRGASGRYLVFVSNEDFWSCSLFCAHGDMIAESVPALGGLIPLEYTYSDSALLLLLTDSDKKSGRLIALDEKDVPHSIFSADCFEPASFCFTNSGITVGGSVQGAPAPFLSAKGKISAFLIGITVEKDYLSALE